MRSKFFQSIRNNQGFTMVEIMIAGSLMMVIGFGVMKFMEQQKDQQVALELRAAHSQLTQQLNMISVEPNSIVRAAEAASGTTQTFLNSNELVNPDGSRTVDGSTRNILAQ